MKKRRFVRGLISGTAALLMATLSVSGQAGSRDPSSDAGLHDDLVLPYRVRLPERNSARAPVIVLLHGMGGNEQEWFSLRERLPGNYAIVAVRAPYTVAPGRYQWFAGTLVDGRLDGDSRQIAASRAELGRFIDQVVSEYRFDEHRIYLVGFSQGAIMSYQVGLTEPGRIKGIGALSGAIFTSLKPMVKVSPSLTHLRVFIAQGADDPVVPPHYAVEANRYLLGLGLRPQLHIYPGVPHVISDDALHDLDRWLESSTRARPARPGN